jgi:glycosyltransferase involved in cell wall biosynthesis
MVRGEKVFIWVGGLHERKDPLLIVRAFAQFSRKNPGLRLYMIYQSSELIREVKDVINGENAFEQITLVGEVAHADLINWYNSADFIVSTSKYEGSGVAVVEGLSCGCVPILSDIPSFRMMTSDGSIGLLFGVGHLDGLINTLQKSLQLDIAIEKQKVLKKFADSLSFTAIAHDMMKLFRSIADG